MNPISEVYNVDCLEYMKTLPDKHFDLAIVDPPYGLPAKSTHGRGKLKDRSLNRGNIHQWDFRPPKEYFDELFRVSKNQIIWGGNYFELPPCRCFVCWDKEQVWENFSQCEFAWTSFDKPAKMIRLANRGGDADKAKFHPTAKNVKLYEYLLRTFANKGDIIFAVWSNYDAVSIVSDGSFDMMPYRSCSIDVDFWSLTHLFRHVSNTLAKFLNPFGVQQRFTSSNHYLFVVKPVNNGYLVKLELFVTAQRATVMAVCRNQ